MPVETPKRVMLATDLTPAGDRAFDRAVQLVEQWNADLIVCHVIESSALRPWGMERRVRNAETELDRLVRTSPLKRKIARHIVVGDPADRTLQHADAIDCDFLVTGPAHGKILGGKLLGSTAARMMRRAKQPVLAVRHRPQAAYATIVSAVDFSPASREILSIGRVLFPSASFTALHAYSMAPNWGGLNADKSIDAIEADERARVIKDAEQDMSDLLVTTGGSTAVEVALLEGDPETVLSDYVEKNWPDLLIAGTHGRSAYQTDSIGSVAELLLTKLPCDVLAIPTRK